MPLTLRAARLILPLTILLALGLLTGCVPAVNDTQFPTVGGGTWGSSAPSLLPVTRQSGTAAASGGMVQHIGGSNGGSAVNDTWVLDPTTGTWISGFTLSAPLGSLTSAVDPSGTILALGGANGGADSNLIQRCSGACLAGGAGTWSNVGTLTAARERFNAVTVGGQIYLFGGCTGGCPFTTILNTTEALDPTTFTTNTALAQMPTAREDAMAQAVNGIIYVIGGGTGSGVLTTVEAYDPATNTWTTKAPLPAPREFAASGVLNGNIYVVGGGDSAGNTVDTVFIYVPTLDTWFTGTPAPHAVNRAASAVLNGSLYVIAGDLDFGNTPQQFVDVLTP